MEFKSNMYFRNLSVTSLKSFDNVSNIWPEAEKQKNHGPREDLQLRFHFVRPSLGAKTFHTTQEYCCDFLDEK